MYTTIHSFLLGLIPGYTPPVLTKLWYVFTTIILNALIAVVVVTVIVVVLGIMAHFIPGNLAGIELVWTLIAVILGGVVGYTYLLSLWREADGTPHIINKKDNRGQY